LRNIFCPEGKTSFFDVEHRGIMGYEPEDTLDADLS